MRRSAWVLGSPIGHSLSPAMHQAAYDAMGLEVVYLAARVEPPALEAALRGLQALGALGCNLTRPLKEVALRHLDEVEEPARTLGAVNTVRFVDGRMVGCNTDAEGWLRSWDEEVGESLRGRSVVLLGAGGAARALLWAVLQRGAGEVQVVNRDLARARRIVEGLPAEAVATATLTPRCVVVNATPVGMDPQAEATPLDWPPRLPPGLVACDLVYRPRRTRFLREAEARGARTLGGLGMLVHQAAAAIELWTGRKPPVDAMRAALS